MKEVIMVIIFFTSMFYHPPLFNVSRVIIYTILKEVKGYKGNCLALLIIK